MLAVCPDLVSEILVFISLPVSTNYQTCVANLYSLHMQPAKEAGNATHCPRMINCFKVEASKHRVKKPVQMVFYGEVMLQC